MRGRPWIIIWGVVVVLVGSSAGNNCANATDKRTYTYAATTPQSGYGNLKSPHETGTITLNKYNGYIKYQDAGYATSYLVGPACSTNSSGCGAGIRKSIHTVVSAGTWTFSVNGGSDGASASIGYATANTPQTEVTTRILEAKDCRNFDVTIYNLILKTSFYVTSHHYDMFGELDSVDIQPPNLQVSGSTMGYVSTHCAPTSN